MNETITKENFYESIIKKSFYGYSFGKLLYNDKGFPIDYIFIEVNDVFEKILPIKIDNIAGKHLSSLFPEYNNYLQEWLQILHEAIQDTKTKDITHYSIAFKKWYHIILYSLDGQHIIAQFIDITKYKNLEQELLAKEELYALAIRGSDDGIFDYKTDTREFYISPKCKEYLGYKDNELANNINTFKNFSIQTIVKIITLLRRHINSSANKLDISFRMIHKNGFFAGLE